VVDSSQEAKRSLPLELRKELANGSLVAAIGKWERKRLNWTQSQGGALLLPFLLSDSYNPSARSQKTEITVQV
jgi:hypothetical protein